MQLFLILSTDSISACDQRKQLSLFFFFFFLLRLLLFKSRSVTHSYPDVSVQNHEASLRRCFFRKRFNLTQHKRHHHVIQLRVKTISGQNRRQLYAEPMYSTCLSHIRGRILCVRNRLALSKVTC